MYTVHIYVTVQGWYSCVLYIIVQVWLVQYIVVQVRYFVGCGALYNSFSFHTEVFYPVQLMIVAYCVHHPYIDCRLHLMNTCVLMVRMYLNMCSVNVSWQEWKHISDLHG